MRHIALVSYALVLLIDGRIFRKYDICVLQLQKQSKGHFDIPKVSWLVSMWNLRKYDIRPPPLIKAILGQRPPPVKSLLDDDFVSKEVNK